VRPPRQSRSQDTLDRILDAAEVLVQEKGFEDTPVAEVVRRAGSSVGAFYTRFPDKTALLHALYDRYYEQAIATADAALDPRRWDGATIPEIFDAVLRFLVQIYRERAGLIRAFVIRNYSDAEFRMRHARLYDYVSERLSSLVLARADEIGHPDPERGAALGLTIVFSALESVMLFGEGRSRPASLTDEGFAAELTRAYLAYLGIKEKTA
jgi:AcrR family transcriptional regulator